jgi:hypothetical protein
MRDALPRGLGYALRGEADHERNNLDEQRVPNLEEMNEEEVRRFLAELFSHLSAEEEYEASRSPELRRIHLPRTRVHSGKGPYRK